jgi:hypothetical protein
MSKYYVSGHYPSSYVFNFAVEILLILIYDLRSVDKTTNGSPSHAIWVLGIEVQITTSMSRFPARWIMIRKIIFVPMYHRHKLLDLI